MKTLFHQNEIWKMNTNQSTSLRYYTVPFYSFYIFKCLFITLRDIFQNEPKWYKHYRKYKSKPVRRFWVSYSFFSCVSKSIYMEECWLFVVCFVFQWLFISKLKVISFKWSWSVWINILTENVCYTNINKSLWMDWSNWTRITLLIFDVNFCS